MREPIDLTATTIADDLVGYLEGIRAQADALMGDAAAPLQEAIRRLLEAYPAVSDALDRIVLEALTRRAELLEKEGDRMSSLARISLLLEDLKDELKDGRLEPAAGMIRANELAETVVDFIADLTVGPEPPTDMLDQVAEAASQAQQGYEAVRERLTADSPEQDTLGLLAGYWEMRAVAAGLEASVVRNRSAMLAAVPAPEPSAPALLAPSSAPAPRHRQRRRCRRRPPTWRRWGRVGVLARRHRAIDPKRGLATSRRHREPRTSARVRRSSMPSAGSVDRPAC